MLLLTFIIFFSLDLDIYPQIQGKPICPLMLLYRLFVKTFYEEYFSWWWVKVKSRLSKKLTHCLLKGTRKRLTYPSVSFSIVLGLWVHLGLICIFYCYMAFINRRKEISIAIKKILDLA